MRIWITRDARKYKGVYEMWPEKPQEEDLKYSMWWSDEGGAMQLSDKRAEKLLGHGLEYGTCECIGIGRIK